MLALSFNTDKTIGALSIGYWLSCVIFGIFFTQVFSYFQRYPADRTLYKMLVILLCMMELLDQIFLGHAVYFYSVSNFGNASKLIHGNVVWTLIIQIILGCTSGTIVKGAFALRVWRFSKQNMFITGVIVLLILAQLALGIAYTIRAFQLNKLTSVNQLKVVASLSLGAGLVTDTVIASALCYYLQKLRTGFKQSDSLVNRLSVYAINTGALTSAISLCTLILYNTYPEAFYFMGSYFVLGKLYAISFLATLNTRKAIRGKGTDRDDSSGPSGQRNAFFMMTPSNRPPRFDDPTHTRNLEVDVRQEITILADVEEGELKEKNPASGGTVEAPYSNTKNNLIVDSQW